MAKNAGYGGVCHEMDPLIPILNLVCMLIPLLIFGAVFVQYHTLEVSPPALETSPVTVNREDNLNLYVLISRDGFHLKVNPTHLLPWMNQASADFRSQPDIPKKDDGYDFSGLTRRLQDLKNTYPKEHRIILGAEDTVEYDVLIKALDASRGKRNELFPLVQLTRGIG